MLEGLENHKYKAELLILFYQRYNKRKVFWKKNLSNFEQDHKDQIILAGGSWQSSGFHMR